MAQEIVPALIVHKPDFMAAYDSIQFVCKLLSDAGYAGYEPDAATLSRIKVSNAAGGEQLDLN